MRRAEQEVRGVIALLDTSHNLDVCAAELGCEVGQLLTPLTGFRLRDPSKPWAIDNGAFSGFDEKKFYSRLRRAEKHDRTNCKFVAMPDRVADALTTMFMFHEHYDRVASCGWPIALVLQDGQDQMPPIPWSVLDAIFIGGTNQFKGSMCVVDLVKEAKHRNLWVHAGRVNGINRFEFFEALGVDSCDGSGIAQYSLMRHKIAERKRQEKLFDVQP